MARPRNDSRHAAMPGRIRLWLLDNPGQHRARDIGIGLGVPEGVSQQKWSMDIGRCLSRMLAAGQVTREQVTPEGWKQPVGYYALPGQVPATTDA